MATNGAKTYFCASPAGAYVHMAQKKNIPAQEGNDLDIGEVYSRTELFLEKHKRNISIGLTALLVVVAGLLGYRHFIAEPQAKEAAELMWKAEYWFEIDSLDLAINGDGNNFGFDFIASKYGSTPSGRLAHYYLGAIYMQKGEYELALEHYGKANVKDDVLRVMAVGNMGDAYVELGRMSDAARQFEKAAGMVDNEFLTPLYLMKAGIVHQQQGDWKAAAKAFRRITTNYPTSAEGNSARKYLGRAEAKGGA